MNAKQGSLLNKTMAASWRFRSVCKEDLDKVFRTTSRFVLKQLDFSLPISMREKRDRNINLELII